MAERRSRGTLESAIMQVLWSSSGPLSVTDVREHLTDAESGRLAYTTVVTVLNRLCTKGMAIKSVSAGGNWVYTASQPESSHAADLMLTALLDASNRGAALLHFAGSLGADEVSMLRQALAAQEEPGSSREKRSEHPGGHGS